MAAADDDVPILRTTASMAGTARADPALRLKVERDRVRRLGRDAMRELFRADRRCRRLANAQLPVEAGEDRLDADERIRLT